MNSCSVYELTGSPNKARQRLNKAKTACLMSPDKAISFAQLSTLKYVTEHGISRQEVVLSLVVFILQ